MPAKKAAKKAVAKPVVEVVKDKKRPSMTVGFYILLIYFAVSFIGFMYSLIMGRAAQPGIIFGAIYDATSGLVLGIISILIVIVLGYGIIKRVSWTRELALVWYGIMALQAVVTLIVYAFSSQRIISFLITQIPPESLPEGVTAASLSTTIGIGYIVQLVISLLIVGIILLFYYKKKNYFSQ